MDTETATEKQTLTHWSSPKEMIESGYGNIPYQDWCERERDRINARSSGVRIVTRERDGHIALSR